MQMLQAKKTKTKWNTSWRKGYDNNAEYNPEINRV